MADERDPKVTQRYRELPGEEPSRELDQHILAAAHRATGHSHAPLVTPAGRHRWYFSLGAAAVLVFAVAITLHLERQQPDLEAVSAPPAPEAPMRDAANQEAKKPEAPAPKRSPAAKAAPAEAPPPQTSSPADAVGAASAPRASAPASRVDAEEAAARERMARVLEADRAREPARQDAEAKNSAEARARSPAAARSAPAPAAGQLGTVTAQRFADTPDGELERIARLRRQGRDDDADKALAEFRKRYPDYQISAEMRAKVERAVPASR
jgi:hypothetical protein